MRYELTTIFWTLSCLLDTKMPGVELLPCLTKSVFKSYCFWGKTDRHDIL
jgi:hypothetical protein